MSFPPYPVPDGLPCVTARRMQRIGMLVDASFIFLASVQARKLAHFTASPLQTKPASLGFRLVYVRGHGLLHLRSIRYGRSFGYQSTKWRLSSRSKRLHRKRFDRTASAGLRAVRP